MVLFNISSMFCHTVWLLYVPPFSGLHVLSCSCGSWVTTARTVYKRWIQLHWSPRVISALFLKLYWHRVLFSYVSSWWGRPCSCGRSRGTEKATSTWAESTLWDLDRRSRHILNRWCMKHKEQHPVLCRAVRKLTRPIQLPCSCSRRCHAVFILSGGGETGFGALWLAHHHLLHNGTNEKAFLQWGMI